MNPIPTITNSIDTMRIDVSKQPIHIQLDNEYKKIQSMNELIEKIYSAK